MENIRKSKNITNDTKNVYWKQQCSTQCYKGVKPGHTTKRSEETPTVWLHMQDGRQQEVKDTDVRNCRWNEIKRQAI